MKFRKKPVEIEAHTLAAETAESVAEWCGGELFFVATPFKESGQRAAVLIHTLEGTMQADEGDWIIKGVQGEFYPCKPDIFAATYDPVE